MVSKTAHIILITGSAATAAFFAGKYHERNAISQRTIIPHRPTVPVFNTIFPPELTSKPTFCASTVKSVSKKVLPKDAPPAAKAEEPRNNPEGAEVDKLIHPNAEKMAEIMSQGFPGLDNIIVYSDYVISYDKRNRVAHWACERLTAESVKKNKAINRAKLEFRECLRIHPYFRAQNEDFKGSGYDRGHLAAAGNHTAGQNFMEETYELSNIAPQVGKGFNRDSWNRLERYVRGLTKKYETVYCCTGPLYVPRKEMDGKLYVKYEVIGPNQVAVPTHFYKVVVGQMKGGALDMEAYVMRNAVLKDTVPLKEYQVPPEIIERLSGLNFFDAICRTRFSTVNGQKKVYTLKE